jgi:uncharacterized protein YuzE
MKLTYDPTADAVHLRFSQHPPVESEEIAPGIVFDFDADADNRLVAIEVLNAKTRVAMDTLGAAAE